MKVMLKVMFKAIEIRICVKRSSMSDLCLPMKVLP